MQRTRVWLPALLACLALASSTAARAQGDYARTGPYLGLAGSLGIYTEEDDLVGSADIEEPLGLNARVGYRAHPHFAAEAEFEWLSEADVEVGGSDVATIESWIFTANGKGYLLTGRVQPYGLVGLGGMVSEVDGGGFSDTEGDFAARLGGGVDIYITPNILGNLGVTYVIPTDDLDDFNFVSIGWGFGYRF